MKKKWLGREGATFFKAVSPQPSFSLCPSLKLTVFAGRVVMQVTEIQDMTQADVREVEATGTHTGGDKLLHDLKKRKLISQKSVRTALSGPKLSSAC